jgi:hypothetical protein
MFHLFFSLRQVNRSVDTYTEISRLRCLSFFFTHAMVGEGCSAHLSRCRRLVGLNFVDSFGQFILGDENGLKKVVSYSITTGSL